MLAELNDRQRQAVLHEGGPLLIVAGAGTGKTATLAHRVAYKIATGADPGRILLLTFTRRAAGEMLRRVDGILRRLETETRRPVPGAAVGASADKRLSDAPATDRAASGKVWGGTFHATATRLLRLHGRTIGLDPSFTILDRGDAEDLMGVLRTELGLSKNDRRFPLKGTCMDIYSRCVNARETVEETVENHFPWCRGEIEDLRRLFSAYVDHKGEQSVLDYDDLLLFWHGLLTDSRAARSVHARFDLVLVDEYQDTNRLQAEILQMLCPGGVNLTAVGDDAQAIYSFRAATVRNILDFPQQLPDTTVVTLERNYRSTQPILDATNEVMAGASERHAKDLWTERREGDKPRLTPCEDENEQTEFIIRTVLDHREAGLALRRQAVLFRASHHSLALELELARRNIPFRKYGGLRFVETAHVKDLMAFLRLAENPRDLMAGTRVLMLLPGVGPKKARALMDRLGAAPARFAAWSDCPAPSAASAEAWNGLVSLMADIASRDPGDLASQIKRIRLFYTPLLQRLYDNARARVMDLEQLEWLAARFPDRARFLAEIALDPPAYTEDLAGPPLLDEDFLILSTMHSAKGLEWDVVFVIHAADGNIPSDMATGRLEEIEEERRLFYVALTRAKDWLYVCYPVRYYSRPRSFSDAHGYAQLTRFVSDRALRLFDLQPASATLGSNGPSAPTPGDTAGQGDGVTTEDIRRRLKDLF
ncbi:MAG: ATP-dependent helicase [Actinobacteria bacterium]|jgi:DNA helicase-2/ATP-dependent DNA helicase PcrA|nr:ATP-dependent helicase [Actinomycetota bacterium]